MCKISTYPICFFSLLFMMLPKLSLAVCTVTINASPGLTVCSSQSCTLTANPSGGVAPYTYLWSTLQTTQSIVAPTSGTYSVTITDAGLCTANNSVVVTVNASPTPAITGSNVFCPNFAGAGYSTPLVADNTYLWTVAGGTFVGSPTNNTVTVNWGGAGNATLSVKETTTLTGCNTTVSKQVLINSLPTPFVSGLLCVCVNSLGVTYSTPSVAGSSYVWVVTGGTFTGQGTNQITVNWGAIAGAGPVTVTETNAAGCVNSNTLNVTISAYPVASVTIGNNNACSGTTVNFQGPAGTGYTYLWNFDDLPSGTNNTSTLQNPGHIFKTYGCGTTTYNVTLTVTNSCGCSTTSLPQAVTIKQQPNPQLADQDPISPFSNCDNNPTLATHNFQLTLNNITSNAGCITGYTIDWGDGAPIEPYLAGFTTATHLYTDLGAFDLVFTANGTNGCTNSITYTVANQSVPAVGISNNGGNTAGCYPITFTFTIDGAAINSPGTTYEISYGDGATETKTNAELLVNNIVSHTYTTSSCGQGIPGNQFTVKVNATNACLITVEATVNQIKIYKPPVASFTTSPTPIGCVNTSVCFTNTSTPGYGFNCNQVTTWLWNFGDPGSGASNTSTLQTPPCHIYSTPGTYTITLTASNDQCPAGSVITHTICIDPSPSSSFTVNKDIDCKPLTVIATNTSVTANTCGDLVYTWSVVFNNAGTCTPSAGLWSFASGSDLHSQHASFIFNDQGTYTITLAVQNACTTVFSTKTVTVKTVPKVTVANLAAICAQGTVNPSATYELCYGGGPTFQWLFPGGSPAGSTSLIPGAVSYNTANTYTITLNATNECGTGTGSTTLLVKPIAIIPVQTATICSGGSFTITPANAPPVTIVPAGTTYSWPAPSGTGFTGGVAGTNLTSIAGTLTNTTNTTQTAVYTITPSSAGCPGPTFTITVTINPKPVIPNQTTAICSGSSFTVSPGNAPPGIIVPSGTTYTWPMPTGTGFTGGAPGTNLPSVAGTLTNTTNTPQTAVYTVTPVSGDAGACPGSPFTVTVTVNPNPIIPVQTATICSGGTFTITPVNNLPVTVVPPGTTYSWPAPTGTGFTGGVAGISLSSITGTLTNTTNTVQTAIYSITPTAGTCTGALFTVTVTINPKPLIPAQTLTLCSGDAFNITPANAPPVTVVPAGTTYTWLTPAGTGFTGGTAGTSLLSITGTLTNTTNTTQTATYTVTPTSGTCPGVAFTVTVNINPKPVIPNQTAAICIGNSFSVNPANNPPTTIVPAGTTYSWPAPVVTGGVTGGAPGVSQPLISGNLTNPTSTVQTATYTITPISGAEGNCPGAQFTLVVTLSPIPQIPDQSATACGGSPFTVAPANLPPTIIVPTGTTYSWPVPSGTGFSGGAAGINQSSVNGTLTNTTGSTATATYIVTPSSGGCPGASFNVTVTINPYPVIPGQTAAICSGGTFTITPGNSPPVTIVPAGTTYTWPAPTGTGFTGGTAGSGQTLVSGTLVNTTNTPQTAVYTVTPTSGAAGACTGNTFTVTVIVNPNPVIPDQTAAICSGAAFTITPLNNLPVTVVPPGTTYTWSAPTGTGFTGGAAGVNQITINGTLTNITNSVQTAIYTVTPTSGPCVGIAFTVDVTINPKPLMPGQTATVCSGTAFVVAPTNNPPSTIVPSGTTYTWSAPTGTGFTGGATGNSQTSVTGTLTNTTNTVQTATYTVTPTSGPCSGVAFTVTVTINPKPVIPNQTAAICIGNSFSVSPLNNPPATLVPAGTTYTWPAPVVTGGVTGGAPGTNQTLISGTLTNPTNTVQTATYTVTPTSGAAGNCEGTQFTLVVTLSPIPQIPVQTSAICSSGTFTVTPVNNPPATLVPAGTTYSWSAPSGTGFSGGVAGTNLLSISGTLTNTTNTVQTATYNVTPSSGGCPGADFTVTVSVNPKPVIPNQPLTTCSGSVFAVTPVNSPPNTIVPSGTTYSWPAPTGTGFTGGAPGNAQSTFTGTLTNITNTIQTAVYIVTPTSGDAGNCVGSNFIVTVTINPTPIVPAQTAEICSGSTFTVVPANTPPATIVPAGTTYSWSAPSGIGFSGGTSGSNQATISGTLTNTTGTAQIATYTVTPTSGSCPGTTFTVTVTSNPLPVIDAGAAQTIPYGTSTSLPGTATGGTGTLTISWTPIGSIATGGNTLTPTTTNLYLTTIFTMSVTDTKGCASSDNVIVSLNGNPLGVTCNAAPGVICNDGSSVQLSANASGGSGTFTYGWVSNPVGWTSTLPNPVVNPAVTTIYTVTVNDGFNTVSNQVTVTVNPLPAVFNITGGGEYCSGGLGVPVGLDGSQSNISYQLYKDGVISGTPVIGNAGAITFGNRTASGIYTVVATNTATLCPKNMTGSVPIAINPLPTANAGVDQSIAYGTSVILAGTAGAGTEPLGYSWTPVVSIGGGGATLSPQTTNLYSATTFTLLVTDSKGCTASDNVIISLNGNPLSVTCNATPAAICNNGASVQLNAVAAGGSGTYTYIWASNPVGTPPWSSILSNPVVTPTVTTSYSVTVNDGFNTVNCQATVTVNPLPGVFNVTGGGEYCSGGAGVLVGLDGSQSNISYQLYKDGIASGVAVIGSGGTITFGNRTAAGIYTVVATNTVTTCTSNMTGSVSIVINPLPTANAGTDQSIAYGISLQLSGIAGAGTVPLTYSWTPTGSIATGGTTLTPQTTNLYTATTFTLLVTDSKGCTASDNVSITLNGNPLSVMCNALPTEICNNGSSVLLNASGAGGSGSYTFTWTSNPGTPPWSVVSQSITVTPIVSTNYTVTVNDGFNTATCNVSVTVNPLPAIFPMTGGGEYCSGGAGVPVGLSNSVSGINYQLYLNGAIDGPSVPGNGSALPFGNKTAAGTYTVRATNSVTTCWQDMSGNAVVTINPLPIVNAGSDKIIPNGTSTTLAGAASGGSGTLSYSWDPAGSLVAPINILTPHTTNIYSNTSFTLLVSDSKGCQNSDVMDVILSGNPLAVVASILPVEICDGETAQLTSSASGGSGTYTYSWSSLPSGWTSTQQNPQVSPSVNTAYNVVANDGFNTVNASVSLIVNPLPIAYNVTGGGSYCFGGTGVLIGLANSETGVTYQLFRGVTALTPTVAGVTGSPVSFGLFTIEGTYTIKATRVLTGCQSLMTGSATVTILPLPAVFTVTGGGSYPTNGIGVLVGLSDSEIGVNYMLYNEMNPVIPLPGVAGTGAPISFGYQTLEGSYTVVATNVVTGCQSNMSGNATIIINPYPSPYEVTGGGVLCLGDAGKPVGLSDSEIGVRYILLRNNNNILEVEGTGDPLDFGIFTLAGTYTVQGVNIATSLTLMMNGNAIIIVNPLPLAYLLVPQGDTCYGTEILINGSQAGVDYSLYKGNTFISMVPGTGLYGLLSFGHIFDLGTFRVEGVNHTTGCRMDMIGTVTLHPLPLVFNVIPPGILCPGESVLLSGSEIGIDYQLMRNDLFSVGPPIAGTGLPLDFGPQYLPGVYRVTATNPVTHCFSWMDLDATIEPSPIVYNILPSGDTCAPAHVRLNGSQTGIEYRLIFNSTQILTVLNGTGLPLDFGVYTTAGDYQVMAINNVTHCEYWMGESLHIFAAPIHYNILPNGITCAGSIIGLDASEPGVTYTLIRNGSITVGTPVIGTGTAITFGPQTEPGTYTIEGKIGSTQCHAVMNGTAVLQPNPAVYIIEPSGNQCAGTEIYLSGSQVGITYKLLRDNIFVVAVNGTGSMLLFGQQLLPGIYTMEAVNTSTNCESIMDGTVTILPGPLAFTVMPVGINCSPTTITLENSEVGILYQLRREHLIDVDPPLTGTGSALDFGLQTIPGLYEVVAHNPTTDCYSWMTGGVTIQTPAMVFNILPSGNTCAPALVRLNGSEIGKRYDLYLDGTILLSSLAGTGLPLEFGTHVTSGAYTIVAVDAVTFCENAMADVLTIFPSPEKYNVVPGGIACANMNIGLDDSEIGVEYTLIRDGNTIVTTVSGTGAAIWFGIQSYSGDYTVEAVFTATNCHSVMIGTASLSQLPMVYLIEPQGDQCAGTDIYVNGSQTGINYQLFRDNILVTALPGDGSVIHFGPQDLAGLYEIKAINPASLCDVLMTGSTNILAGPLAFNVTPGGANCSPAEVGLAGSEVGVNYQLYWNGFAIGALVPGTGLALTFGLQPAGTYQVIAQSVATSCFDTMPGPVIITNGPLVQAGSDATICATHTIQLSGSATNYSTVLWSTAGDGLFSNDAILDPVYTPGPADIANGTVTLLLTIHGSPACLSVTVSDPMVVTINPFPTVDAGTDITICKTQTATLNGITQDVSSMHWITKGDGSFDNANVSNPVYTPGIQDKATGQVMLRLIVHGALTCIADTTSDFMTIHLEPLPMADAGLDDTICENWVYRLSGSATHQSAVIWTTLGDGTFDNPLLGDASYTAGPNDRMAGIVRLVLTATGTSQCSLESDRDTMRLILNKLPLVSVGPDATICANQVYHVSASVQRNSDLEWFTSGDGIFSNIHTLNPTYTPGASDILTGSVKLKLNAHGLFNCTTEKVSDSLILSLYPMPVANAGNDTLSCPNLAIPLHGSATHYMSVLWSTLGDGTFDNSSLMLASYTPGQQDNQRGFVNLVLTVNGEQQCAPQVDIDTVRVNFKPLPTVSLSGTNMICEDSTGFVIITLGGLGPWNIVYTDGTNNFSVNNIPSSPYNLSVSPIITTTYTILSVGDANCTVAHTGPSFTVTVNPQPNVYAMTTINGGGFCEGGIGVKVGIDGSQPGIFYQLLFGGVASGFPMPGTGAPIDFGWKTIPGVYQVKAWHPQTLCEVFFSDSVVVLIFPTPRVDFTSDSACLGQPTQFHLTGLDINKIASWQWNFGDGNVVTYTAPIEPAHLFPASGSYLVSLTVTDTNDCMKTFVHPVSVSELPIALFSHNAPMCTGYEVAFSDFSYAPGNNFLNQWHWDFGDASDTTIFWPDLPDVTHIYNLPGSYPVKLTVTTNRGCFAEKTRIIDVSPGPAANFDYTNGCENENVHFHDISQLLGGGSIVEWHWNFGDPLSGVNNTSSVPAPIHKFDTVGDYHVRLIVMNSGGCTDTIQKTITIHHGPKALFTFNTACLGTTTQFTDISTANAASKIEWLWDFGDGSPTSATQNPGHIYASAGVYPVTLTVKNSNFCSHDTTLNVEVIALPTAGFQTNAPLCHGDSVTFVSTSTSLHGHIVKWVWEFGDGADTTFWFPQIPNVKHAFVGPALQHLVRLTVKTDDSCTAYVEHLINTVNGPVANFAYSNILCPGVNVAFSDLSMVNGGGPITNWKWNFDDPTSGTENISYLPDPVHAFTGAGQFHVKLIISNGGSCKDSLEKLVTIIALPVAEFTFDTVCKGSLTHFTDQSTSNPATLLTWDWDFGDGQSHGTVPNPTHLYNTTGPFTVTLTVMNSGQCISTRTRLVHVNPAPSAAFSNSSVNCSGSSVSFVDHSVATHGYILEWHWNFGDSHDTIVHLPGMSPVNHIYSTGGTFNVVLTVKTSDSCTATTSNIVTVYNKPYANFMFASPNCEATPVQFTDISQANGGGVINFWNWDFGDPGSGVNNQSTNQSPVHSYANAGPYDVRLIVKNANQCYDTVTKPLDISPNPVVGFFADTVCQGELMTFTDTSSVSPGSINSWLWNFGDGYTATTQNPTHLYATPGLFTVTLTVGTTQTCGATTSHQVWVKVPPVALFTSTDHCKGTLTHFTDHSTTPTGSVYSWAWNFGDNTTSSDQNPVHLYANAGTYNVKLVVTNTVGCTDSVTIPTVIQSKPTAAFSYFSPNCPAGKVSFTDHSTPAGTPVNGWNWTFEIGATSSVPSPTHIYNYTDSSYLVTLIVHDLNGCADTIDSTIYVTPGFAFTFRTDSSCLGTPTHFQPVNLAVGDTLHDLRWNFGEFGSGINNTSTLYQPTHTYANPGSYIVKLRAYNSDNCSDSVYKEVVVHPLPAVSFSYDEIAHCDSIITFRNLSTGGGSALDSLVWSFGDGTDTTFVPPLPASVLHRYPGFGLFNVVVTAVNHFGCLKTDSAMVNVACISASFVRQDTLLCQQTRMFLTDSSAPVSMIHSWEWDFGDGQDTTYTHYTHGIHHTYSMPGIFTISLIVETLSHGTSIRDTSRLVVLVKPSPVSNFSVGAVCKGDSSYFINLTDSNGVSLTAIRWRFGDPVSGADDSSHMVSPAHQYLTSGKHTVTLISQNKLGCVDTIRRTALVHKLPQADFSNTTPCQRYDILCNDKSVKGDTILSKWLWNLGNPANPYDTLFTQDVTIRYDSVATYVAYMKVTDKFGCSDTVYKPVTVRPSPIAAFTVTDNVDGKQGKIKLNNHSSEDAKAFKWTFGNGKSSVDKNPVVTYTADDKEYTIELVTWNDSLCYDTTALIYKFLFDNLFVPNAFSPTNHSGSLGCRLFQPKGLNLQDYHVTVFDKWGHLVWESNLLQDGMPVEGWDGTFNGKPMPQDVYMWKISATFTNGKVWEGSESGKGSSTTMGTVTLIR
ncbi:MAG: PKD domain-containing protein [Bacteroidales bacterium]